jgi:hypothetical protein
MRDLRLAAQFAHAFDRTNQHICEPTRSRDTGSVAIAIASLQFAESQV